MELDDLTGLDLMRFWHKQKPQTQFVILDRQGSIENAVAAIKAGASEYLVKPVGREKLLTIVRQAIEKMRKTVPAPRPAELDAGPVLNPIIGLSPTMKTVLVQVARAAVTDSTVLILGENGTGKELVANALHQNSSRSAAPFVAVNVSAAPAALFESELFGHVRGAFTGAVERRVGRLEQANSGTLFMDEIGDFELHLQPKLLRVLETRSFAPVGGKLHNHVDVRVITATNRDLAQLVREGSFREDLYYRLNVVQIRLPALRERIDDIPALADYFLAEISQRLHFPPRKLAPEALRHMLAYRWPGNVRELRNTLERMLVLADGEELTERDLPEEIRQAAGLPGPSPDVPVGITLYQLEKLAISKALARCSGNRTHAASQLGISVRTLQRKLLEYQS